MRPQCHSTDLRSIFTSPAAFVHNSAHFACVPHLDSVFEEHLHHLGVLVDDGDGERGAAERVDAVEVELRPRRRAGLGSLEPPDDLHQ